MDKAGLGFVINQAYTGPRRLSCHNTHETLVQSKSPPIIAHKPCGIVRAYAGDQGCRHAQSAKTHSHVRTASPRHHSHLIEGQRFVSWNFIYSFTNDIQGYITKNNRIDHDPTPAVGSKLLIV